MLGAHRNALVQLRKTEGSDCYSSGGCDSCLCEAHQQRESTNYRGHAFLFSLCLPKAGFLVKSMRLIPTNIVGRPAKESDCYGSHVKRASTIAVTIFAVHGELLPGGEGLDVGHWCGSASPRTLCQLAKFAMTLDSW